MNIKNLNKEQLKAVKHKKGPLLIIAGAGTGKTTVITERIVYLINQGLAEPEEILALTFTEKASQEMEERVDVALPLGYNQMWISTFHAFCDRVLRDHGLHIGLDTKFKLLTQAQTTKLIKDNIFEFNLDYFRPLGNPTKFVQGLLVHFSRLQDENVLPGEYLKWAHGLSSRTAERDPGSNSSDRSRVKHGMTDEERKKFLELANAYKFYSDLKIKEQDMLHAWNESLPKSIVVRSLERVNDSFHPCRNVLQKTYYYMLFFKRPLPFFARYGWFYRFIEQVDWNKFYIPTMRDKAFDSSKDFIFGTVYFPY